MEIICIYQFNPELIASKDHGDCNHCKSNERNKICRSYTPVKIKDLYWMFNRQYVESRLKEITDGQ
jgi:hypothetical protein